MWLTRWNVQYPLSPVQAVGIVLASLDGKMADSKTFDKMKGWKAGAKGLVRGCCTVVLALELTSCSLAVLAQFKRGKK